ncbi:hypothetical protein ACFCZR_24765 [Streptomyces rubiginosohelvolus]|uniref:hypothetical protein n=1 Tax=Streptomyces rubiginosohelvolus TaxID=67362 RepID=UPI0035DFE6E3
MAWDGIPWFIENTAASQETLRLIVEAAAGGGEGIIGPTDLQVSALDLPAAGVRVGTGAMIAKRRGAAGSQSYAARMETPDPVDIEPTGADGPRSDLIVARVEDPYGGEVWPEPADPMAGPYVFTRVIPDVPPGTTSIRDVEPDSTAITLARIDLPASTSTVTAARIIDLRQMVRPRTETQRLYLPSAWATVDELGPVTDIWEEFPLGARWTRTAPEWATHVGVHARITGLRHPNATVAQGELRVYCGDAKGLGFQHLAEAAGRVTLQSGHTFLLPPEDRGRAVTFGIEGKGAVGATGVLQADAGTVVAVDLVFSQAPVVT